MSGSIEQRLRRMEERVQRMHRETEARMQRMQRATDARMERVRQQRITEKLESLPVARAAYQQQQLLLRAQAIVAATAEKREMFEDKVNWGRDGF